MIDVSTTDSIRFIYLNSPPVNALGAAVRAQLLTALNDAFDDAAIKLVVLGSRLPLFCAGADIQEFRTGDLTSEPELPTICAALDNAPKLTLAAINGTAMGGALELALSCDYRIGLAESSLGLPEVTLGLLPGAGGTQRLPRIIDVDTAIQMVVTGKPLSAKQALDVGLLDELASSVDEFESSVSQFASELLEKNAATRPCSDRMVDLSQVSSTFFADQRFALEKKLRGQVAPLRCVDAIELASKESLEDGLKQEREMFDALLQTPQARSMIHLFFAERDAQKIPGVTSATSARSVETVGVVGAGTMGVGISIALLDAGLTVILLDQSEQALQNGSTAIDTHYRRALERKKLTLDDIRLRTSKLTSTLELSALAEVDLVIEAVVESYEVKCAVFSRLDQICKPGAILASNTSTLDLNKIASNTKRPEDVIGLHFFSPANVMRLLEIVRGEHTSAEVLKTALRFARRIRKVSAVVNVCFGFVGNRMLEPYFREASRLMLEGARASDIDRVLTEFGMAMGVLSMGDLAGIDVGYLTRDGRRQEFAQDPAYQAVQDKLYALGRYGQKTGRGVYLYEGRTRIDDPDVENLCRTLANDFGVEQRDISDQEILERCLFPLINEGLLILEEGIAYRSGDCDLIWVNGYGFPAARGGPMQYASEIGYSSVLRGMQKYQESLGDYGKMWFAPADSLYSLAERE